MSKLTKIPHKRPDLDGFVLPASDRKDFFTCLYALLWLEQPEGDIFQQKAARLIQKYQPKI